MAGSREYPYSPHERLLEILKGKGFLQCCKIFLKESMKLTGISKRVEEGFRRKTFWGEDRDPFRERTHCGYY